MGPGRIGAMPGSRRRRRPATRTAQRDGRQLLGWAAKQVPDAKGVILSFGKKHGLALKVVEWTPEQVTAAYRYARSQGAAPAGPPHTGRRTVQATIQQRRAEPPRAAVLPVTAPAGRP